MNSNISDVIGTKNIGILVDLKISVNDNGKLYPKSILVQSQKIIAAYEAGETLPYGGH